MSRAFPPYCIQKPCCAAYMHFKKWVCIFLLHLNEDENTYCKPQFICNPINHRYVLRDDHPYCIKCYENVFANNCDECGKIIGIDSKV